MEELPQSIQIAAIGLAEEKSLGQNSEMLQQLVKIANSHD